MADLRQLNELHQFNKFCDEFPLSTAPRLLRDRLNPLETWSEEAFRRRYRLRKRTVVLLTDLLRGSLEPKTVTCNAVPPLQVLCAPRCFAKGSYQDEVADIHGISQPTQSRIVRKVSQALCERRTQFVHFPTSRQASRPAGNKGKTVLSTTFTTKVHLHGSHNTNTVDALGIGLVTRDGTSRNINCRRSKKACADDRKTTTKIKAKQTQSKPYTRA
ncbi:hypothetical protein HPB48_006073 [Haemaphysalis longicornis]|uniref:Transposase Helix-turn-helix domain-containing protein n=1 Tax=Haemaphysalis longicornis TaxID=44386 RepID=A0A9J6G7R3_HAELO|nr:hypothetical protein HPB48_006073 [Haemaphysalis longicornis]